MNRITDKRQLSADVFRMTFEAPYIAEARRAGKFIIIQLDDDFGERIPLTNADADADADAGTVAIIFQAVGKTTLAPAEVSVLHRCTRSSRRKKSGEPRCYDHWRPYA